MAKSCSIADLTPQDAARVKARKGNAAKLDFVTNELIPEAVNDYRQLIADVQAVYPELINNRGEFFRDLRVQQQLPLELPKQEQELGDFEADAKQAKTTKAAKKLTRAAKKPPAPPAPPAPPKADNTILGATTVQRAPNFESEGQYIVTLPSGREERIFRDTEQFGSPVWHVVGDRGHPAGIGFTRAEAVAYLEGQDGVRKEETKVEAGGKKPGAGKILRGKQPGGTSPAAKGKARLTAATKKSAEKSGGQQVTDPKEKSEKVSERSQPARAEEPKQTERTERETPGLGITQEATDFISAANRGAPATFTNNLRRIAKENGIDTKGMTPGEFVKALEEKRDAAVVTTLEPPVAPVTPPVPPRVTRSAYVADLVTDIETATTKRDKLAAVVSLFEAALTSEAVEDPVSGKSVSTEGALEAANSESLLWTPADVGSTIDAFIEVIQLAYSDDKVKTFADRQTMWDFAIQHDMFREAYVAVTAGGDGIKGFTPTKPTAAITARIDKLGMATPVSAERNTTDSIITTLTDILVRLDDINSEPYSLKERRAINNVMALRIQGADLAARFGGGELTLKDWLTPNKQINWRTDGTMITPESFEAVENILNDMEGRSKIFNNSRKPITRSMPHGIAKGIVSRVMRRFNEKVRPKHRVYKNLAELRRKDPKLYAEANASRRDGKTIPDTAAGYAFGNHILIFSDNVSTRQELTFTVLHEVIGHFGLGSLMPTKDFRALMDDIYRADPVIRRNAEALKLIRSKAPTNKLQKGKSSQGLGHYEAIEEALADRAADLNNSIIAKVANAIRRILNALGFTFNDDLTRFFIDQSLRYQRTGMVPDASAPAVYQHLKVLSERSLEGRASVPNIPKRRGSVPSVPGTPESPPPNTKATFHDEAQSAQAAGQALGGRTPGERLDGWLRRVTERKGVKQQVGGAWGDLKKAVEDITPMNNIAQYSEGMHTLYRAFVEQAQELAHLKTKYINGTEYANRVANSVLKFLGLQEGDAPSAADIYQANRGLEMNAMAKKNVPESVLQKLRTLLGFDANGNAVIDYGTDEKGEPIRDKDGKLRGAAAAKAEGHMTRKEIDEGIQIPVIGDNGKPATNADGTARTELFKLDQKLSDNAWRIIQETRLVIDEAALDTLVNNVNGVRQNQATHRKTMADNQKLSEADLVILDEILVVYARLHDAGAVLEGQGMKWLPESRKRAARWLHNTTRVLDSEGSTQKLSDWKGQYTDPKDKENMEEFRISTDKDIQSVVAKLPQLGKGKQKSGVDATKVKKILGDMHALNADLTNAELRAKNTLASAYIPFDRPGKYQIRVQAFNDAGKPIRLVDTLQAGLLYSRTDSVVEAQNLAEALTDALNKSAPIDGILDEHNNMQDGVTFRGVYEVGLDSAPLAGAVDYSEIFRTLLRAGIELNALDRQKLVELTAAQNSTARHNLQKEFVPGWDQDIQRSVRNHLERQANIGAKNLFRHIISDTLTINDKLWLGDPEKLKRLQDTFVAALATRNEDKIFRAKRDMDRYQLQFEHAMPVESVPVITRLSLNKDGTLKTEEVNGRGLGLHYKNKAIAMVSQYTATHGMPAVTGDQKLGEVSGIFMTIGAASHLGGAIAPAAINTTSIFSHAAPFIATYNTKTGFGLGHGMPAALRELYRAMHDVSLFKDGRLDRTGSSKAIRELIEEDNKTPGSLMASHGLTRDEAEMLFSHTDKGTMTANITNALTGANGFLKRKDIAKTVETWMFLFTKTEQYNRRVTGLAAYRLERDRMLRAEGVTFDQLSDAQKQELSNRVDEAIDFSQGNYEKFNHPSIAQGPILTYLWMYKQFQATTILLFHSLAPKERVQFLAFFILAAGLKGIPFEEDFADLVDTIMQTFSIDWDGLDAEMVQLFEAFGLPAGLLIRGPIDYYLGFTFSTRISQSKIIPGSGFLKAGADPWREAKDIIGPVFGAWSGILGSAGTAGQYILETVGLADDVTTLGDVLRTGGGLSAVKNLAKGITYFIDGTVTNDRGQLVTRDISIMSAIFQMFGFLPASATRQYDVNRINGDVVKYNKEMTRGYVDAYNKANPAGKRHILKQVREWNKAVGPRSPLRIGNLGKKVAAARKAADQTSVQRSIAALPKTAKLYADRTARSLGLDRRGVPIPR